MKTDIFLKYPFEYHADEERHDRGSHRPKNFHRRVPTHLGKVPLERVSVRSQGDNVHFFSSFKMISSCSSEYFFLGGSKSSSSAGETKQTPFSWQSVYTAFIISVSRLLNIPLSFPLSLKTVSPCSMPSFFRFHARKRGNPRTSCPKKILIICD